MKQENEKISELIIKIKGGNKKAFDKLYEITRPKAFFIALKILQNEHDAEDVLQESYIKFLEKIDEIDVKQNFLGWFYQVVANKSKDVLKSRKNFSFECDEDTLFEDIPDESIQFNPEEKINQDELHNRVINAIENLTPEKRACIILKYFADLSVREIAESLEVPESTVKNRLFMARKELKDEFEKQNDDVFCSIAPLGAVAWALNKSSESIALTVSGSASTADFFAKTGASVTKASTATSALSTGVGAKVAALSVTQKVIAGFAAASVIGGTAAGVATVSIRNNNKPAETSVYTEEVTTAPSQITEFVFAESTTELPSTEEHLFSSTKQNPATVNVSKNNKTPSVTDVSSTVITTHQKTNATTTRKAATTRKNYFLYNTTTQKATTTRKAETSVPSTTLKSEPTTEETTFKETTTTEMSTTETTVNATATLIIDITDFDDNIVDTLTLNVDSGTELTWDFLVELISANGYEAMAGVYGESVGAVANPGQTYKFTAEL